MTNERSRVPIVGSRVITRAERRRNTIRIQREAKSMTRSKIQTRRRLVQARGGARDRPSGEAVFPNLVRRRDFQIKLAMLGPCGCNDTMYTVSNPAFSDRFRPCRSPIEDLFSIDREA